jgi:hypothetical protein
VLAECFEIDEYEFKAGATVRLVETMKDKGGVWEDIVRKNELQPTKLEEVGLWWFADAVLSGGDFVDSMNKSKGHGFLGFRNSKNSFVAWINKMKVNKIVP